MRKNRAAMQAASSTKSKHSSPLMTAVERKSLGIRDSADDKEKNPEQPWISLKYYSHSHQCFSEWSKEQLKGFSGFCRILKSQTWEEIYNTGGVLGNKTGLGYTKHKDRSKLPKNKELDELSPDLTFFELRIGTLARVHGFRVKDAFFLVWLDNTHSIYKM